MFHEIFAKGDLLVANIRDVAKIAGVSASTVSRVLNGTAPVNDRTRSRVLRAMSELNYSLSEHKEEKKKWSIGIIIPKRSASNMPGHPAFYSATTAFIEVLEKNHAENTLVLLDEGHLKNIEDLFSSHLDGYFILGTSAEEEDILLPFLKAKKAPYIILNRWVNEKYTCYVNVDDVVASYRATKWLIDLGHKKIAFIGGDKNFRHSKLRLHGYTMAMEESGLSVLEKYIFQGEYNEDYGYTAGKELFHLKDRPTAGFFTSDMIAIGAQCSLRELGMALPQEFAMVSWGNFNIASYVRPALTTVNIPHAEMGIQAANALLNLLNHPSVARVQILMEADLVIRDSCGSNLKL